MPFLILIDITAAKNQIYVKKLLFKNKKKKN